MLDPHQLVSVDWLLAHPRGGLADEMRVGKTAPTVIAAARSRARRILVLCPAIARGVWREAARDWYDGDGEWRIFSYDEFSHSRDSGEARRQATAEWAPDTVILDECHYLKSSSSLRTRAVYGPAAHGSELLDRAERVWLLSGTPCPNGPHELWTHQHAVFNDDLTYYEWLRRYCIFDHTEYGVRVTGSRPIARPELRAKFREHWLRRTFREVHGRETLVWNVVPVPVDSLPRDARKFVNSPAHRELLRTLRDGGEIPASAEAPLATLRRLTVDLKADLTAQHVREYLEDPTKSVLVLGVHREALARIADLLGGALVLGGMGDAGKQAEIDRFQRGEVRVLCGQVEAMGMAVDASRADAVVFAETAWTPGVNVQAAMRSQHRDKTKPVPVDVLVLEGSIDEAVERVKVRKLRTLGETY